MILITGGSGFLGINLIRYLLNNGIKNIISFDLIDFDYPEKNQITTIVGDIRDKNILKDILKNIKCVIHTAAALPLYSKQDILTTDIDGTKNLLEISLEYKVDRFIHISSTAVYGIPDHHPLYEDDELKGVGHYGNSKIEAEILCNRFRKKGMCIPILRPKSFIGPERLGIFSILYDWSNSGRNFPMIGGGKNRYQLLDVEDLCAAIYNTLVLDKELVNDTFNIGAKEFSTMKEDYQAVLDYAGYGKKIINFPVFPILWTLRLLDIIGVSPIYKWVYETAYKDSFISIKKAENILGFNPRYSNKDALIRNYIWYIENIDSFKNEYGVSHRVPWNMGILNPLKKIF